MNTEPETRFRKTRIAPTPSGFLHIGNILSFCITAALARRTGAKILLRIDDLDQQRTDQRFIDDIFTTLHFLEIPWDEGPRNTKDFIQNYSQVLRLERYQQVLDSLGEKGQIFPCSCTRTQLAAFAEKGYPETCLHRAPDRTQPVNWRLNTSEQRLLHMKTVPGNRVVSQLPPAMRHFVVRKKDGYPSYQLASVMDDLYFGIDLIVRGADLPDSTAAQLYLAAVLGADAFSDICFLHHPLLMKNEVEKLSKSAGDTSVKYLREQGQNPAAIFRMIGEKIGINQPIQNGVELGEWALSLLERNDNQTENTPFAGFRIFS